MIRRYLTGKSIHVVSASGTTLCKGAMSRVWLTADGRHMVEIAYNVLATPTEEKPLPFRVERIAVEYPTIKWDKAAKAFVARVDT